MLKSYEKRLEKRKIQITAYGPSIKPKFPQKYGKKKSPYLQSFVVSLVTSCDEYEQTY